MFIAQYLLHSICNKYKYYFAFLKRISSASSGHIIFPSGGKQYTRAPDVTHARIWKPTRLIVFEKKERVLRKVLMFLHYLLLSNLTEIAYLRPYVEVSAFVASFSSAAAGIILTITNDKGKWQV